MRRGDTTDEIAARQVEAFRRMGSEGRFRAAVAMTEDVRALVAAGVRHRQPGLSEEGVAAEVARIWLGRPLDPKRPTHR
jgi:hypothetical protein